MFMSREKQEWNTEIEIWIKRYQIIIPKKKAWGKDTSLKTDFYTDSSKTDNGIEELKYIERSSKRVLRLASVETRRFSPIKLRWS